MQQHEQAAFTNLLLLCLQAKETQLQAQTDSFLQHNASMTPDRSVPKVFTCYGFVKTVDPLRQQAFLNGYLGLVDLKDRATHKPGAYLYDHKLYLNQYQVVC